MAVLPTALELRDQGAGSGSFSLLSRERQLWNQQQQQKTGQHRTGPSASNGIVFAVFDWYYGLRFWLALGSISFCATAIRGFPTYRYCTTYDARPFEVRP